MRKGGVFDKTRTVPVIMPDVLFERAKRTANDLVTTPNEVLVRAIEIGLKVIREGSKEETDDGS